MSLSRFLSGIAAALLATTVAAQPALQDPAIVVAEVESFLQGQTATYPGSAQISVETPRLNRQPACDILEPFLTSGARLRARTTVGVRCLAPEAWSIYVQANVSIQGYYYVATRTIQNGEIITLDDMTGREGDILKLPPNVVVDPSQALGYIAKQRINPGTTIKASALRDPNSIERGQTVRTEARGMGFVATGEGQALQNGAPGQQIQVRSSSGQVVSGIVVDANTVRVM